MNKAALKSPTEAAPKAAKSGLSLAQWILISLGAGIVCGLFFGEATAPLQVLGNAFVGLMQMTVMPYIVLALVGGIGKLTGKQSKLLLGRVALIMLGLWAIALIAIMLVPLALPKQISASFFSSSLVEPPQSFNFFGLFIPANPFQSLAENKVPAVVLFCLLCGAAVVGMKNKDELLRLIDMASEVMSRVTRFIVGLSPLGVFCIAASAAGTMQVTELGRIQGYLVVFTLIGLGLGLLLLPMLISAFTPFRYRDLTPLLRSSFILAFATGKTLVVLPMLIDGVRELFEKRQFGSEESQSTAEVLVPLGYSFPHMGRLLTSIFIPFAAWYIGSPLRLEQYPMLIGASTFVHFSNAPVSIPFLLDLMQLPNDLFQLFLITAVYVGRLTDAVAASYLMTLTVLGTCVVVGLFKVRWRRLTTIAMVTAILTIGGIAASRAYLSLTSTQTYNKDQIIASMQLLPSSIERPVVEPGPNPVPLQPGQSRLTRALERGVMRIGFDPDGLPFSYYNADGELVGFDIEMAYTLAEDLGVNLEFVPILDHQQLEQQLAADHYDMALGGLLDTVERSQRIRFSEPYLYVTMAFVVPDHVDEKFATIATMNKLDRLRIGVLSKGLFRRQLAKYFPTAEVVILNSARDYFEKRNGGEHADAFLYSAEAGAAWTLLYPRYQVITPLPRPIMLPLVYPYGGTSDVAMDEFLDNWVMLKTRDGSIDEAFDYWIMGKGTDTVEPRWSIIRNVMHWVE